jgi:hypothetical protein
MFVRALALLAILAGFTTAFNGVAVRAKFSRSILKMSSNDPMDAIRAKMASDPNYDPMKDPQAMQQLEAMIPQEMREFANAIERLKVAFTDATTGNESIEDLDSRLETIAKGLKGGDLISSPQSDFFRNGMPEDNPPFDAAKLKELAEEARRDHPEVPLK